MFYAGQSVASKLALNWNGSCSFSLLCEAEFNIAFDEAYFLSKKENIHHKIEIEKIFTSTYLE